MENSSPAPVNVQPRREPRVYFFERQDGVVIAIDGDSAAWTMYAHPTRIYLEDRPPRYLGQSNGRQYEEAAIQAKAIAKEQGLEAGQAFLREAFNKEVEIAKTNKTPPPDCDTVDKYRQPYKI